MNLMNGRKKITGQNGFTLIEVMVALVIFTISLLGLAGLQVAALRDNHLANLNTIATQLAEDMAERLRANPVGVGNGSYDNIDSDPGHEDCYGSSCSPDAVSRLDAHEWLTAIGEALPSGKGRVIRNVNGFTITIMWDQERTGATGTGCSGDYTTDLKCLSLTIQP